MLNEFSIGKAKEYIEKHKNGTDMYIAVSLFKEGGDRVTRGKAADSIGLYGLWLDIDVQCYLDQDLTYLAPQLMQQRSLLMGLNRHLS